MCSARPAEEGPVRVARGNVTNINFFGDCFRSQNAHEHTQASRRGRERVQHKDRGAVPRLDEKPPAASSCTASSVSAYGILHKSEMPPHARARMRGSPSVQTQYILTNGHFNSSHDVLAASLFPTCPSSPGAYFTGDSARHESTPGGEGARQRRKGVRLPARQLKNDHALREQQQPR